MPSQHKGLISSLQTLAGLYKDVSSLSDIIHKLAPSVSLGESVFQYADRVVTAHQSALPPAHMESLTTCTDINTAIHSIIEVPNNNPLGGAQFPHYCLYLLLLTAILITVTCPYL